MFEDISPRFKYNEYDSRVGRSLVVLEETPEAIQYFSKVCNGMTDYGYWFFLSTLWVSYTGHSDLELWKKLFSAKRKFKTDSIMKPSELQVYNELPSNIKAVEMIMPCGR